MPPLPSGAHSRRSCNLAPPTAQCRNGARRAEAAAGHDRRAGRREPDVAAAASELAQRMALEAGAAQAPPPLPPARRSSVPSPAGPRAAQPAAACTGPARADAAGPSHKRPRPAEQSNGGAGPGLQLKRSRLAVNAMLQADGAAARGGVASPRASDHRGPASPRAAGGSRGAPAVQPLKRSRWAGDQAPPARGASAGANDRAGVASPRAEAGQNAALFRALGGAPAAQAPAGPATQRARCVVWRRRPVRRLLPDSMSATQHCRQAALAWSAAVPHAQPPALQQLSERLTLWMQAAPVQTCFGMPRGSLLQSASLAPPLPWRTSNGTGISKEKLWRASPRAGLADGAARRPLSADEVVRALGHARAKAAAAPPRAAAALGRAPGPDRVGAPPRAAAAVSPRAPAGPAPDPAAAGRQGGTRPSAAPAPAQAPAPQGQGPAQEPLAPNGEAAAGAAAGVQPAEAQPAGVQPAEVQPAEVQPAEVQPAMVQPAEVQPAEVQPAEVQPAEGAGRGAGADAGLAAEQRRVLADVAARADQRLMQRARRLQQARPFCFRI